MQTSCFDFLYTCAIVGATLTQARMGTLLPRGQKKYTKRHNATSFPQLLLPRGEYSYILYDLWHPCKGLRTLFKRLFKLFNRCPKTRLFVAFLPNRRRAAFPARAPAHSGCKTPFAYSTPSIWRTRSVQEHCSPYCRRFCTFSGSFSDAAASQRDKNSSGPRAI